MKKKTIRKTALTLALMKLLAFGTSDALASSAYQIDSDGNLVLVDMEPTETCIIDDNNVMHPDIVKNFGALIANPEIWNSLQSEFPTSYFNSHAEALSFYNDYFKIIIDCGNEFIATLNQMFDSYSEEEFENEFGAPKYINGVLNYGIFLNPFFNYSGFEDEEYIKSLLAKTFAKIELTRYAHSREFLDKGEYKYDPSSEDLAEWFKNYKAKNEKIKELSRIYENSKDDYITLAIVLGKSCKNGDFNIDNFDPFIGNSLVFKLD